MKYVWKSTISCLRRKMSSISEFFRMFKVSLCHDWLTNLDEKCTKRSVKMWTTNFLRVFPKMFCCTWVVGCWKFVQYILMLCPGRFILVESVFRALCYKFEKDYTTAVFCLNWVIGLRRKSEVKLQSNLILGKCEWIYKIGMSIHVLLLFYFCFLIYT